MTRVCRKQTLFKKKERENEERKKVFRVKQIDRLWNYPLKISDSSLPKLGTLSTWVKFDLMEIGDKCAKRGDVI